MKENHYASQADQEHHALYATQHARRRAKQKLGVDLTDDDVLAQGLSIWAGQSVCLGPGAVKRELHLVRTGARDFIAVYDTKLRRIVTYLKRVSEWKGTLNKSGQMYRNKERSSGYLPTTELKDVRAGAAE